MCCTIAQNLKIVSGTRADYESLSHYHYREAHIGPYCAIYALKGKFRTTARYETAGVIVYSMPTTGCIVRNTALGFLADLDKQSRLALINKNIRTISRVIIEPRFRSLGLAARLVRETMPLLNVPYIEAMAVMGHFNPFLEKAGMTRYDAPPSPGCVRLVEALGLTGIDQRDLIAPELAQQKLDSRFRGNDNESDFIEREITHFLKSYGRRRHMPPCIERTKFILGKLTESPVYYLWKNPGIELRV